MVENVKLSTTILEVIADTESYPANINQDGIRNSDAIKENFENINLGIIVFHINMLVEAGLVEAEFGDILPLSDSKTYYVTIIGLTKQGSDHVRYIRSSFWDKAKQELESDGKPLTIQLIFSLCDKLIRQF